MKIVHVSVIGPYTDNWTYQENLLLKYQRINGNEVTLVTTNYHYSNIGNIEKIESSNYYDVNGVKIYRLPIRNNKNIHYKFKRIIGLEKTIIRENPDILFVHGLQFVDIDVIRKIVTNYPNIRLFIDNHADDHNSGNNLLSRLILHRVIWRYYARKITRHVEKFFGVTPSRMYFLEKMYKIPIKKIELLIMGADDDLVNRYSNNNQNNKFNEFKLSDTMIFAMGGKIEEKKPEFINVMKMVKRLNNKYRLLIFGSVSKAIEDQFRNELSDNVIYLGWLSADEIYQLFGVVDFMIFPGLHSVLWEQAAGFGLPMITNYIEGFNHINLNDNCILTNNEDEIVNTMNYLIGNPKVAQNYRERAREIKKRFLYSSIARQSISNEL